MLHQFLGLLAAKPFVWGETDCALTLADWHRFRTGHDPAAHLRGRYASEEECRALLEREGPLPRLVARLARSVGAERTSIPEPGDFAVVRLDGRWWGAIMTPTGRWMIKGVDGVAATCNCRVVAAWSARCP